MWTKLARGGVSMREAMVELAGKPGYGELPNWFEKVASLANISIRNARSLWNGEIQNNDHRAARAVRNALEHAKRERELASARQETAALAARYIKAIGGMRAQDPDFFGEEITRLERLVDRLGVLDRA